VVFGNNRCALAGVDLNRQWKTPVKSLHPTVYTLKIFMQVQHTHTHKNTITLLTLYAMCFNQQMQRKLREVHMYIDLHGHSRKYNVFMYGVEDKKKPKPQARYVYV
jgi:hypothetical protein